MKLAILSVTPSPYQRDFFTSLHPQIHPDSHVFYLEGNTPDSPWPTNPPRDFESILPGKTLGKGRVRIHYNSLPTHLHNFDALLLNIPTTSWTLRRALTKWPVQKPWFFWGEIASTPRSITHKIAQNMLTRPLLRASAIMAVGEKARADYAYKFPLVPTFSLPYSSDLTHFLPVNRPIVRNPLTFLFCGQMIMRKGIDVLLNAFQNIQKTHPTARLRLAGRTDTIQPRLDQIPPAVRAQIDLVGFLTPEALPSFFASGDIFVLPSRHDGWGVVIPQAMAAGLPILSTTATGAAVELVTESTNGWLISPDSPDQLTLAMLNALDNPAQLPAMGRHARDSVRSLTPATMSRRLLTYLSPFV